MSQRNIYPFRSRLHRAEQSEIDDWKYIDEFRPSDPDPIIIHFTSEETKRVIRAIKPRPWYVRLAGFLFG